MIGNANFNTRSRVRRWSHLRNVLVWALVLMTPALAFADLRVVATLPVLGALAQEVGGEHVQVTSLARNSEDPHYVEARPDFILPLSRADLLIAVGMDLEVGWLPSLRQQSRNPRVTSGLGYFEAGGVIAALGVPAELNRAHGDVHAGGNPHFMYDARALAQVARGIGDRMAQLDPDLASVYRASARSVASSLDAFAAAQRERFGSIADQGRVVVAYHDSFPYLFDWLGVRMAATVEPRPGVPPTPAHTAQVVSAMRSAGVQVIVQEGYYPDATSATIAQIAGATVLPWRSGPESGETVQSWLSAEVGRLYNALL